MSASQRTGTVIIGGGVIGASIAWQLARRSDEPVVLIERHAIGSGASALAAGLINHARSDADALKMVRATVADIDTLEATTGDPIGFKRSASLRIAERPESIAQLHRTRALLHANNVPATFIDADAAETLVPWLHTPLNAEILHIADDGYVDGQSLSRAYARAAKLAGAAIVSATTVNAPIIDAGKLVGVDTSAGPIYCNTVINAAGPWAGHVLGWFGRTLAATALRSHYWITEPRAPRWPEHPIVMLPDATAYLRAEVGGLLVGIQERVSRHFDERELLTDMTQMPLTGEEDWDLLAAHAPQLKRYLPAVDELAFKHHLAGITTYTPDGKFLIGKVDGIDNLFLAAGCCGTGIACAGGISRLVRDLVLGNPPQFNAAAYDANRFAGIDPRSPAFIARCIEARASKSKQA